MEDIKKINIELHKKVTKLQNELNTIKQKHRQEIKKLKERNKNG